MTFDPFDPNDFEAHKADAKARWGNTKAYAQYEKRGNPAAGGGLMTIIAGIAALRSITADSPETVAAEYVSAAIAACTTK